MVAKCVNPYCHRPFRYMDHGKLFVTEYPPTLTAGLLHERKREHFWLCEECAKSMTVAIRREHSQIAIRIINLSPSGARKLDFVPEEYAVNQHPPRFSEPAFPEFSFEAR